MLVVMPMMSGLCNYAFKTEYSHNDGTVRQLHGGNEKVFSNLSLASPNDFGLKKIQDDRSNLI